MVDRGRRPSGHPLSIGNQGEGQPPRDVSLPLAEQVQDLETLVDGGRCPRVPQQQNADETVEGAVHRRTSRLKPREAGERERRTGQMDGGPGYGLERPEHVRVGRADHERRALGVLEQVQDGGTLRFRASGNGAEERTRRGLGEPREHVGERMPPPSRSVFVGGL